MDKLMTKAVADATGVMDDTAEIFINRLAAAGYAVVPREPTQEVYAALKRLTFAARTSGGTAGPDAELMAACEQAEAALAAALVGREP